MTGNTNLPPWAVTSMPTVWLEACDPVALARSFRPLSATVHPDSKAADALRYGQALWGSRTRQGDIALAWDWVEVQRHVYAIADPMQILSNVQLRLDDGAWMNERHRILWLNDLLHALPWQAELAEPAPPRIADNPLQRLAA